MARDNGKKAIYFTVTAVPTAAELVEIAALEADYKTVLVRRADTPANLATGQLEPGDAIAGSPPAAYVSAVSNYQDGQLSVGADDKPESLIILPAAAVSVAAAGGTAQLRLVKAQRNMSSGAVTLSDITSGAESVWSSGTPAKATIDADSGLVTGAAGGAGTTLITATVTYDTDKTMTATKTVTVT